MANNTEDSLLNSGESSFLILDQGSLPLSVNSEFSITTEPQRDNSFLKAGDSAGNTLNGRSNVNLLEDNTEENVKKLLEENYQLKETLNQINLAIKSQLDTFIMWQQEVLKTHETHKQKFLETKNLVLKLKAENANLKKELEKNNELDLHNFQTSSFSEKSNLGNLNVENLNKEIYKHKANCIQLTAKIEDLNSINYELVKKLKEADYKVINLNKDIEELTKENNCLKEKLEKSQRNLSESEYSFNSEARAQINNLFKQLEEERDKNSQLKEELASLKSKNVTSESKFSLTNEFMEYLNKLNDMNLSLNNLNKRHDSFRSWVTFAEENMNAVGNQANKDVDKIILSEIAEIKSHLHQEESIFKQKQESLQEMHSQFSKLLEDYKDLKLKLNLLEKSNMNMEHLNEEVTNLSSQLKIKNEELESKKQECERLQENLKELDLKNEEIEVLRTQLQIYQADFNEERQAREKIVGEKEDMAEEIRLLHSVIKDYEKKGSQSRW